jgi:hypothetical protein
VSEARKRPMVTGPDEVDYHLWDTADALERLRAKAPALARQAARAALDTVKGFEQQVQPATARRQRGTGGD